MESLIDRPANPMAPTNPINPKLAWPIVRPKNASPVHQKATLKINPACLNEFKAATNAIIIKIKKISQIKKVLRMIQYYRTSYEKLGFSVPYARRSAVNVAYI